MRRIPRLGPSLPSLATRSLLALAMAVATAGTTACSSSDSGTLKLVTGEEDASATFAGVTNVAVNWVDSNNVSHSLAQTTWPASSINLGTLDESTTGMIEVTGTGDAGQNLVFGSVVPLEFGSFDGVTVPVFVQRVGDFARLPDPPDADSRTMPLLGVLGGRYIVVAGGADPSLAATTQLYDLLSLQPFPSPPTFTLAPESMAVAGTSAYLFTDTAAQQYNLSDSGAGALMISGGTLTTTVASIAGGSTVIAADGSQYIVGGTRTTHDPTAAVLRIDGSTGDATWLSLTVPRWGAAATWLQSVDATGSVVAGLIVAGGSASGPGAELIPAPIVTGSGTTQGSPQTLSFPADPAVGAGATTFLDSKGIAKYLLLAGGANPDLSDPGVRLLDLQCGESSMSVCPPTTWPAIPIPIVYGQAFAMPALAVADGGAADGGVVDTSSAVLVGSEIFSGTTHVFRLTSTGATELPTKVPHTNARAIASPIGIAGGFFLFGGSPEIESFAPPF